LLAYLALLKPFIAEQSAAEMPQIRNHSLRNVVCCLHVRSRQRLVSSGYLAQYQRRVEGYANLPHLYNAQQLRQHVPTIASFSDAKFFMGLCTYAAADRFCLIILLVGVVVAVVTAVAAAGIPFNDSSYAD
jgi:hypothetical protein